MKKPTLDDLIGCELEGTPGTEYEGKRWRITLHPVTGKVVVIESEQRNDITAEQIQEMLDSGTLEAGPLSYPSTLDTAPLPATRAETEKEIESCAMLVMISHNKPDDRAAYRKRLFTLRKHLIALPPTPPATE